MRTAWEPALDRAHDQLALLSRSDKIAIALHDFASVSDPDVMVFDYADGPNGVRGHVGATAFPSMLAMAASFDRQLAAAYGVALAQETVAAGRNVIFSPGLDIVRVPWGGRTGQQLSEDPFLAGEIGGVIGAAVQSQGVMAMATHYVANNFEWLRTGANSLPRRTPAIDVRVSQRTLHEIYLEPFRRALAGHGVASFMGSYNRLNGEYVCQSAEILNLPRQAWGWAGVSLPDFIFAVRDPRAALLAGLDLPSLGDAAGRTDGGSGRARRGPTGRARPPRADRRRPRRPAPAGGGGARPTGRERRAGAADGRGRDGAASERGLAAAAGVPGPGGGDRCGRNAQRAGDGRCGVGVAGR